MKSLSFLLLVSNLIIITLYKKSCGIKARESVSSYMKVGTDVRPEWPSFRSGNTNVPLKNGIHFVHKLLYTDGIYM